MLAGEASPSPFPPPLAGEGQGGGVCYALRGLATQRAAASTIPRTSNVIAVPIGAVGASSGRLAVVVPSTMAIGLVPKAATLTMSLRRTPTSFVALSSGPVKL